jgi:exopolyphosphatase/guanosine-5'-triphosphate,3'-diphosphate pyrophosphatase
MVFSSELLVATKAYFAFSDQQLKTRHFKGVSVRAAVIDIGSNSIKLAIGEAEAGSQDINILEFLKSVVPISKHTFLQGIIPQEVINQTVSILEKYKQVISEYEVTNVTAIATTAIREARNSDIFIDTVLRKTGIKVEVLAVGDVVFYIDAYLSYKLKDTYPIHDKNLMIAEIGTGGMDISILKKGFTVFTTGLSIGTFRLKQLVDELEGSVEENIEAVKESIENEFSLLKRTIPSAKLDDIILIDENYSPYLTHFLPKKKIESKFYQISEEENSEVLSILSDSSSEEIARKYKVPHELANTITAYAIILSNLYKFLQGKSVYIFETSLAEAILANSLMGIELAKKYDKTNQLISVAKFICQQYNVDMDHAQYVAGASKTLFDNLKETMGLAESDALYLILAAWLHDIGMFIHNRSHHKHTEYILNTISLFRLTEEEMKMIACIARYHRKAPPSPVHMMYNSLPNAKRILVQKLSAILRIANALDRSHRQKAKSIEVKVNRNEDVSVVARTSQNFVLEKTDFAGKKKFFEEITGNRISLAIKQEA